MEIELNTYKREIENVDKHHALNYIVQSTAADSIATAED